MEIKTMKDWTIMVYMAGDNNLSADMVYSLRAIQTIMLKQASKLNVLVYYDNSTDISPTQYCDFSDPNDPVIIAASEYKYADKRKIVTTDQNENSATMHSMYKFVSWCLDEPRGTNGPRNRKASRYALIVSGHGSGVQNLSFLKDERSNYYMTVPKFREVVKWINEDFLHPDNEKLHLLGFDNCVMGMLEVGIELEPYVETMVASEGYVPNAGWSYGPWLEQLQTFPEMDSQSAGVAAVASFINRQTTYAIGGIMVDIAAWNLKGVGNVMETTDALAKALNETLSIPHVAFKLTPFIMQAHFDCQSYMFEQNVDLKDFCNLLLVTLKEQFKVENEDAEDDDELLLNIMAILRACRKVVEAVDACILLGGFSGGMYQYSNGISIFFPWTAEAYRKSISSYQKLRFAKDKVDHTLPSNWPKFLETYLERITRRPPRPNCYLVSESSASNENGNGVTAGGHRVQNNTAWRVEGNPAWRVEGNPAWRVQNNTAWRVEGNTAWRVEGNPAWRVEGNTAWRVEGNPKWRADGSPEWRVEGNPKWRVGSYPNQRVEGNPAFRIDSVGNRILNVANRVLGAVGLTSIDFKNIDESQPIFGFTKRIVQVEDNLETKPRERKPD
jgi:hypothetical protein